MEDLSFSEMLTMQQVLQEKYRDKWNPICPEEGAAKLLYLFIEAGEAADIIKKQGSKEIAAPGEVRSHFVEELCDVMMYFNDLLLCYGISPKELREIYLKKHNRNLERW